MDARASSTKKRLRKTAAASDQAPSTGPTSIHDLLDDLLKLVLLRQDSPVWLVRAASTCKRWRGIIAAGDGGAAFLRLSRALHPPAIAGHYHLESKTTEFVPSPSPVVRSSRFTSMRDFLDYDMASWRVVDCYGGLVLLRKSDGGSLPQLVVCDPFARVFRWIPGPPGRPDPYHDTVSYGYADASLLGGGDDGSVSMTDFRVLYRIHRGPRAFLFSATAEEGGDWRRLDTLGDDIEHFTTAHIAGRLAGSLCLGLLSGEVIVLDNATLNFSKMDLPSRNRDHYFPTLRVVNSSGVGMEPQTARIVRLNAEELEVFRQVNGVWVLEHSIRRLSEAARGLPGYPDRRRLGWLVELVADGPGFVVLSVMDCGRRWLVNVDVETMKMAVVPERTYRAATRQYTLPWPDSLFQACVELDKAS